MSQEKVNLVLKSYEGFNRRDNAVPAAGSPKKTGRGKALLLWTIRV